jgi:N-acetylmuramoyl-L-alanine amidase
MRLSPLVIRSVQTPDRSKPLHRRTLVVWGVLVASMTLSSGLLMWLEDAPLAPMGGLALAALDDDPAGIDAIFNTTNPIEPGHWTRIVIHHSGQSMGDAASIGQLHQALGYGGLGYHFVIGNGDGAGDGMIQVGYRWMRQIDGVYANRAISICLVGNGDKAPPTRAQMDQLIKLVTALQARLQIPASGVYLHSELAQTTSPGRFFPAAMLRSQLLNLNLAQR